MTLQAVLHLAWQTVFAPRDVAQLLLALKLRGDAVWSFFGLVVVLNTLAFALSAQTSGMPPALAPIADRPLLFALGLGASILPTIAGIFLLGQMFGGKGTFTEITFLVSWMQGLRFLLQILIAVLAPLAPGLAAALVLFGMVAGTWILLNFVDAVHGYDSLGKSAVVLVLAVMTIILALSMLLQALGVSEMDLAGYV